MDLGNLFRGVLAQLNPFDKGQNFRTFNQPKKKKPEEIGSPIVNIPTPSRGQSQLISQQDTLKPQRPENVFKGLSDNLRALGNRPQNVTEVNPGAVTKPYEPPTPGTTVYPAGMTPPKPEAPVERRNPIREALKSTMRLVPFGREATNVAKKVVDEPDIIPHFSQESIDKLHTSIDNIKNPVIRYPARIAEAVPAILNQPRDIVKVTSDYSKAVREGNATPQQAIAALSGAGQVPLAAFTGGTSKVITGALEKSLPGVLSKVAPYLAASLEGGGFGGLAGLQYGGNAPDVKTQLKSGAEGILPGLALGPLFPGITALFRKGANLLRPKPEPVTVPTKVPVKTETTVPVETIPGETTPVPTKVVETPGRPTVETITPPRTVKLPTPEELIVQRARATEQALSERANNQVSVPRNQLVDDIKPFDTGNTSSTFTRAEIQAEKLAVDEMLQNGELNAKDHKAAIKVLDELPVADDAPKGQPIEVKTVNSIPIQDQTVVPTGLPETPGQVRVTAQADPIAVETQAVANEPVVVKPAALPAEVQVVLDNPKQYNQRTVATAKNQLKLAKKMAKVQDQTAEVLDQVHSTKPASDAGFVPSGELRQGRRGNISEVAHRNLEEARAVHDTANLSHVDVLDAVKNERNDNGLVSPATTRNLKALRDSGKFSKASPEFKAINDAYQGAISDHARALSMTDRVARGSASGDQLTNRFTSKLLSFVDDTSKITDDHIEQVNRAENAFTAARDEAIALAERFKATGAETDFQAWKLAQKAADDADRSAKIVEYQVSKEVLGNNKNLDAAKALQDAEKNAGVYSMDSIDANMLSGTGTVIRNFINSLFPRVENKLFGRVSARAVKPIATVGGSSGRGARIGAQVGRETFGADMAARKAGDVGRVRRTVTAANQLGESNIEATTYSKAFDHYKQILKEEGYSGKDLDMRAEFNVRTDPDGLVQQYHQEVLRSNALSGLTHGSKKIENVLSDAVQKRLADAGIGSKGQTVGRGAAKAVTRVGLGFPTVIARSLAEGMKRATLGIPEAAWSTLKFMKTRNKEAYAAELSKAIQHAGSGGSLILLGNALGQMGVITGAYPSDPNERTRWKDTGKLENSIDIAGQKFSIPGYFGGFALPLMLGASMANGDIKDEASLGNVWNMILSTSPVDNIESTLDIISGNGSESKVKNAVTSLVRSATPAGAFVAEIAKLLDPTQNDTSTKSAVMNIIDNIAGGIPVVNNIVNTTDKTDSYGNVLRNPNPVATVLGAQGSVQGQGVESVNQEQDSANGVMEQLRRNGVIANKNLMQLVDPKLQKLIEKGQPLSPEDIKKVRDSVVKGITGTEDSNWRESGDYETDRAALQTKLQLLEEDPTTKPSEKQDYKDQIARDDVLIKNKIPYKQLKSYKATSLSEWRDMGDPESDTYDLETYKALWDIDQAFTGAGVSYNSNDTTKPKFSAKAPGKGRKGSGADFSSDFGKIKGSDFAPKVQEYERIGGGSGSAVPVIQTVRPNIVHKISSSG